MAEDYGIDVSDARFWANVEMTVEIPMPDKKTVEKVLGYIPIVRCHKCLYWKYEPGPMEGLCRRCGNVTRSMHFCAYGERREINDKIDLV